jgi:hypothetical protein
MRECSWERPQLLEELLLLGKLLLLLLGKLLLLLLLEELLVWSQFTTTLAYDASRTMQLMQRPLVS